MMKKLTLAAGLTLTLTLGAPALADTPIGPGVTGSGGTGPNRSDPATTGVRPGGDAQVRRPEGSEPISGDLKGQPSAQERSRGEPAPSARGRETHPSAPTGGTAPAGATGTVGGSRPSVPAAPN